MSMDNCHTQVSPFDKTPHIYIPSAQLVRGDSGDDIFTFEVEDEAHCNLRESRYNLMEKNNSIN